MRKLRIETPRKYRRQRQHLFSGACLRNVLLIPLFAFAAYTIYTHQDEFRDWVHTTGDKAAAQVDNLIPPTPVVLPDVAVEAVEGERAYRTGNFNEAIDYYRLVIQGKPNDVEAHYRLAYLLLITSNAGSNRPKLEEALDVAEKTINANPEAPEGWAIKGMVLAWMEHGSEAVTYASYALQLDPDFVIAEAVIAQAYWQANQPEQAEATIDAAIEYLRTAGSAAPETVAQIFRTKGYIMERKLDRPAAIDAYLTAVEAAPDHSFIKMELALTYMGAGDSDQALALLRSALDQNPRDALMLYWLGRIYTIQGNAEEATRSFQRCVDIEPTNPDCLSWLGGYKFYAELYSEAITLLEQAIVNGSTDSGDWWQLGRSYYWLGQCEKAIPILRDGRRAALNEQNAEAITDFDNALRDCDVSPDGS